MKRKKKKSDFRDQGFISQMTDDRAYRKYSALSKVK